MSNKLFNKELSPSCFYCKFGTVASDNSVVCSKKGIVSGISSCKKYKYDPLKRQPKSLTPDTDFTPEDFSLD